MPQHLVIADEILKIVDNGVKLLFEHSLSRASEIEHFEIFSHPQENAHAVLYW